MSQLNIFTRRSFCTTTFKAGMLAAAASLANIPGIMRQALGAGGTGKKILFIWMRGANDSLNTLIPAGDISYGTGIRPTIAIPMDAASSFYTQPGACFDPTQYSTSGGTLRNASDRTFLYGNAIPLGNGFAALHPSLKFLAPVYNAGQLVVTHRVGYPRQSRSHFDSQNYWENGSPNNNLVKDGIFYRAILESGLTQTNSLSGITFQSTLPLFLRGSAVAMTNLSDIYRYNMLGLPGTTGVNKAKNALTSANNMTFTDKQSREMLKAQYDNFLRTLPLFESIAADMASSVFTDATTTDGDFAYNLFPNSNITNGGYQRSPGVFDANKYVVDTNAYGFFNNLKAAAMVLERTDAVIGGVELTGFDTHSSQGQLDGTHPNLMRRLGWAIYALRRYFERSGSQLSWNNLVVVTLSEFGRTTVENSDKGTDHAEAGAMMIAGGAVKGYQAGVRSGVRACGGPTDPVPWIPGPANQGGSIDGTMFGVSDRYLKRAVDYRSVFGEIIRDHLLGDADDTRLRRIIPAYQSEATEKLKLGGTSGVDGTPIIGELDVV
jgi:uncharacterized protein (DUF1501 family)